MLRRLRRSGCQVLRQRGSHVRLRCGDCLATVPVHPGRDIPVGTLRSIERQLEPCLGKGWLKR
ncbi:type II toxin-antitoxin system HicA family toxin [Candidatus Poriferisodalis sp.]|uniref:type II toxin-antitoxin system HicA family toxin n=1 Tax=Candidatus Poriferisodalis sp. TaxID=3101277 RepID=UPI003B017F93